MRRDLLYSISILFFLVFFSLTVNSQVKPLTVAESSNYTKTSLYCDVISFVQKLQKQSPYLRVETLGKSAEGRGIPLLIIGNPLPSSPLDLKYDNRAVVYIQANIHAGEVEGKEVSLMLARDILQDNNLPFLEDLVLLITPIFNPDGNEKISAENRRNQKGPEEVGIRYNGQNLDLNRDAIKLESPEVRNMVEKILNRWDPVMLVDCHTTNGSYHQEPVTFVWGFNPNGDTTLIEYMHKKVTPFIKKNMKEEYDVLAVEYGHFMSYEDLEKGWQPAGPQVRYITNYMGLRNRLALLDENYAYADFKTRVEGCYAFLHSVLEYCSENREEIQNLIQEADKKTIARGLHPAPADSFAVEYDQNPYEEKITLRGYEMKIIPRENRWPRIEKLDKERVYKLPYYCHYTPKRSVRFPHAYLLSLHEDNIINKLQQHGITVERLTESATLEVEEFLISEVDARERPYQGHYMNSLKGEYRMVEKHFDKGTLFVTTAQRLGNLIAYLLEPESDDGLAVWNFFDQYLTRQWGRGFGVYPVYKLYNPENLARETVEK
ncbi:MAG: M14 family metallopeptidase [bacterium]